jgi:hypothetical protein
MAVLESILSPQTIAGYVILCFAAAFIGRKRLIGFWGFFFLSLIVTPFATMFFVFVCTPVKAAKAVKPRVKAGA